MYIKIYTVTKYKLKDKYYILYCYTSKRYISMTVCVLCLFLIVP